MCADFVLDACKFLYFCWVQDKHVCGTHAYTRTDKNTWIHQHIHSRILTYIHLGTYTHASTTHKTPPKTRWKQRIRMCYQSTSNTQESQQSERLGRRLTPMKTRATVRRYSFKDLAASLKDACGASSLLFSSFLDCKRKTPSSPCTCVCVCMYVHVCVYEL